MKLIWNTCAPVLLGIRPIRKVILADGEDERRSYMTQEDSIRIRGRRTSRSPDLLQQYQ